MIIIGEKLNSSRKGVRGALEERDSEAVIAIALAQYKGGAKWLDINAALAPNEAETLLWAAQICRETCPLPICVDTPDPEVCAYVLKALGKGCMINSATLEAGRFESMAKLAAEYESNLVCLCMDDGDMPETVAERVSIAKELRARLNENGITDNRIFIDPLISPVGASETAGADALKAIGEIRAEFSDIHIVCGLSNISYGLPARQLINRAFLVAAIAAGLDSAIADPCDAELARMVLAAEAVIGKDEFCENYIEAFRNGVFA